MQKKEAKTLSYKEGYTFHMLQAVHRAIHPSVSLQLTMQVSLEAPETLLIYDHMCAK